MPQWGIYATEILINDITINQIHYKSGGFGEEFFLEVENYGWLHVVSSFMEGVSVGIA